MKRPLLLAALLGLLAGLVAALVPAAAASPGRAQPDSVPAGFTLELAGRGISVYLSEEVPEEGAESEESNEGEETVEPVLRMELVQIVNLASGARLAFHHGPIVGGGRGDGIYGGPNPDIQRQYVETVWESVAAHPDSFCVSTGTFFLDMRDGSRVDPTVLSFPLKRDGLVISEGDDGRRFRNARLMLQLWDNHAAIAPLSRQTFYSSSAPDVITGLSHRAPLRSAAEVGRSWVGTADRDGDRLHETVYLYSGMAVTQRHVEEVLRAFGATNLLMLDGGGSTQLLCGGYGYILQSRPLPQTIVTLQAPVPALPWPLPRSPLFGCCRPFILPK
jgi:hypothetical protein